MVVVVVNNYLKPKYLKRAEAVVEVVREITGDRVELITYQEIRRIFHLRGVNSVILSGSSAGIEQNVGKFKREIDFVKETNVPVLGICFGHQLIGHAFGSKMGSHINYIKGFKKIEILKVDDIFKGWSRGDHIVVHESHIEYVNRLPPNFDLLAKSGDCEIEAMKHKFRPIYSVQFHPERFKNLEIDREFRDGLTVMRNFFKYAVEQRLFKERSS